MAFDPAAQQGFIALEGSALAHEVNLPVGDIDDDEAISDARRRLREAASVLVDFDPAQLRTVEPLAEADDNWLDLLPDCEHVQGSERWRLLTELRRTTLKSLLERGEVLKALNANREQIETLGAPQRIFMRLLARDAIDLKALDRSELAAALIIRPWLAGLIEPLPDEAALYQAKVLTDLLTPMQVMIKGFIGRESELRTLRDYVGILPAQGTLGSVWRFAVQKYRSLRGNPPLVVHGPGGVGKSTLIACFIVEHIQQQNAKLPFVYLDFDRPGLSALEPLTFLIEAARQIAVQFPARRAHIEAVTKGMSRALERETGGLESLKSEGWQDFIEDFCGIASQEATEAAPFLLVLDTFEEVQFLGESAVALVWTFLESLQNNLNHLRIIISGRAPPGNQSHVPLELAELETEPAIDFLRLTIDAIPPEQGKAPAPVSDTTLKEIVNLVGGNPLSLRLAARVMARDGPDAVKGVTTRNLLFLRIASEHIQGQLYERILGHVHDEEVKRLARPGLIVRRITPDIIRRVLAEPCRIELADAASEFRLLDKVRKEAALMNVDVDGALIHRADVRKLMLPDIVRTTDPAVVTSIHRNAIDHYAGLDDPVSRSEELYHRLKLDPDDPQISARWSAPAADRLRDALSEMTGRARLALSLQLKVSPSSDVLAAADQEQWERSVAEEARRYLQRAPMEALPMLRTRKARLPGSPLYGLEAELLITLGNFDEALAIVDKGVESASQIGDLRRAAELLMYATIVYEILGFSKEQRDTRDVFLKGTTIADRAFQFAQLAGDEILQLRAVVTASRLERKQFQSIVWPAQGAGGTGDSQAHAMLEEFGPIDWTRYRQIEPLLGQTRRSALRRQPSLLREIAAEYGLINWELLVDAGSLLQSELAPPLLEATPNFETGFPSDGFRRRLDDLNAQAERLKGGFGGENPRNTIIDSIHALRKAVDQSLGRASRQAAS